MDPLSITAGIIAILGAATTTTSTLSKLRAAGKAPELFDELSNEVEALRSVLVVVRVCLRRVQHSEFEQDIHESIGGLLQNTTDVALELRSMLEFQLRADEGRTKEGRTKVNRRDWMKYGPEVERIKQKIRDARDNLQTGLTALNVIQGDITRQLVVQIQGFHISQQDGLPAAPSPSLQQMLANYAASNPLSEILQYSGADSMRQGIPLPHVTQLSQQNRIAAASSQQAQHVVSQNESVATSDLAQKRYHPMPILENQDKSSIIIAGNDVTLSSSYVQSSAPEAVIVTATLSGRRCHVSCDCACHVRIAGCTPRWLKGVLGQLMFDYIPAIYTRPCTKDSCLKASHKSSFSYHFPSWLAWKTLEFQHHCCGLSSYGSTWSLRLNVDAQPNPLWIGFLVAFQFRDVKHVQESIASGAIHPQMVVDGVPLFLCVYTYSYLVYSSLESSVSLCDLVKRAGFAVSLGAHVPRSIYGEFAAHFWEDLGIDMDDLVEYLDFTALHCAIVLPQAGSASAQVIVQNNMRDIETPDALGRTPLHWACATRSLDFVQALLKADALPNPKDRSGMTALHHASGGLVQVELNTRLAILEILLFYGADVNSADRHDKTPLHQARDAETSQLLLAHDARADAFDRFFYTPLFRAHNAAQVEVLVAYGAQVATVSIGGGTAAHEFASYQYDGGLEILEALARHGANLHAINDCGETPFHRAIIANSSLTLQALRKAQGRDPQRENPIYTLSGGNYLHLAACYADAYTLAELSLLDLSGHHPDGRNSHGDTAEEAFRFYEDYEDWKWAKLDLSARNERRKAWEALVKEAREQNKDRRIEELDSSDDDFDDDSEEVTYPMPGSFDTA
ncbi:hypothetical protein CKM354_001214000 [Cercospora kikuchii]|uniref:Fungal N-terminal domain-containing protein n=1 Tax=Cercospora kikuchii TaxID=84275 RepID=A0A9P3CV31_9PEZI|nr:uncharacterized protein CKM354_001214000 [Cercospora kikuchii]GIZ49101.1 hypothetical protein CKM354_001214000 [Cercospora kikuchii]